MSTVNLLRFNAPTGQRPKGNEQPVTLFAMYFTRFGYLVIFAIIAVAAAAILFVVWPFSDDGGGSSVNARETPAAVASSTPAAEPTATPLPALSFEQVVNFTFAGAVVDITIAGGQILVNLRPDFDVSGLNTTSHAFTTALPPGTNSVEEALANAGIQANTPAGVAVIRQ